MFASISRGSSRVRKSYICSSCLCNIVAHPSSLTTLPVVDRASGPNAPASSHPFSTTSTKYEAKDDSNPSPSADSKSAESAKSKKPGKPSKPTKPTMVISRKERRRNAQSPPSISKSTTTVSALRASMLAEDAAVVTLSATSKSTSRTKKETKASAKKGSEVEAKSLDKVTKELKTKTPKNNTGLTLAVGGRRKKGKMSVKAPAEPEKTEKKTTEVLKEKASKDAITTKAKKAAKIIKVKAKLKGKTFKGISRVACGESKPLPLAIRKVRARETAIMEPPAHKSPIEDPVTVVEDVKAFAAGLDGASSDSTVPPLHARRTLVELIQSGKLKGPQRLEAIKLLRRLLLVQPAVSKPSPSSSDDPASADQSLKKALLGKGPSRAGSSYRRRESREPPDPNVSMGRVGKHKFIRDPPGPVRLAKTTTEYEIETIDSDKLQLVPLESDGIEVPSLAYGLDRVLFNPGVYQLQDPRSKVYNFDPYLQTIMPASEFDFDALKEYITSSRDQTLIGKAKDKGKKYTGSTSSMTSALAHFHFLLSAWRPITTGNLSKTFPVEYETFTALQRAPNAIFLRNRDGVYAIDADKQYDSANILMMLGKSMEKLLTLPTADFEKYRKGNSHQITEEEREAPESFHYTTMGDFLMRSQLDAYDPRLPGSGMFDLKTRAVIAVRMDAEQYEEGRGYQIRSRQGEWESYEREYFDMIRAAFLKYSLQVRMGRMDGIFVAFHNTDKIFGFQYISLPEMDLALHGTEDTKIGDNEFKLSLELLNRVLDRATAKFPGKSLRLHFEARDAVTPFMYIFAEPIEEDRIDQIQNTNKAKIDEFERKIRGLASEDLSDEDRKAEWDNIRAEVADSMEMDEQNPDESEDVKDPREFASSAAITELDGTEQDVEDGAEGGSDVEAMSEEELEEVEKIISTAAEETEEQDEEGAIAKENDSELDSSGELAEVELSGEGQGAEGVSAEANDDALEGSEGEETAASEDVEEKEFIDEDEAAVEEIAEEEDVAKFDDSDPLLFSNQIDEPNKKEILGMTLTIRNKLDGEYIERPQRLDNSEKWEVEYALEEIHADRVAKLYSMCLVRRKRALVKSVDLAAPNAWNDLFIETIKRLSKEGKMWRDKEDQMDRKLPLKTLFPVDGKTITEREYQENEEDIEELEDSKIEETVPAAEKSQVESESASSEAESEGTAPTEAESEGKLDRSAKEAESKMENGKTK